MGNSRSASVRPAKNANGKPIIWPYFLVLALILLAGVITLAVLLGRANTSSDSGDLNSQDVQDLVRDESQAFYTQADIASTAFVNLLTLNVGDTVDGVEVTEDTRLLLKDQNDGSDGLYTYDVDAPGWTRAPELSNADNILPGTLVFVSQGLVNGNQMFYVSFFGDSLRRRDAEGNPKRDFREMKVLQMAPNSTALKELTDNGDNRIELKAPEALGQNLTFTLPDNYGDVYQFLQARSEDGALGWQNGSVVHVDVRGPAVSDFEYPLGSLWVNQADNAMYYLADNSVGASVWLKLVVSATTTGTGSFEYYLESLVHDKGGSTETEFSRLGSIVFRGDVLSNKSATVTMIRSNMFVENTNSPVLGEVKVLDLNTRQTIATLSTSSTDPKHIVATSGIFNIPTTSAVLEFDGRISSGSGTLRMMNIQFEIRD